MITKSAHSALLFLFLFLTWAGRGSIIVPVSPSSSGVASQTTAQSQPLRVDVDVLRQCCEFQDSGNESLLLRCANSSAHLSYESLLKTSREAGELAIGLLSYSTANIFGYGSYSLAINTAFAQQHGLGLRLLSPGGAHDHNYEPRDPRWNKVQILLRALAEETPVLDYAVWLDSDLVVLDFSLRLPALLAQHAPFDLLLSADPVAANGVANSGCVVVRNSAWARGFLQRWWTRFDRGQGMDQHAFSRLWEEEGLAGGHHVKILPPHSLNSHIPAWRHQQPGHQLLHLAGASNVLRAEVFRRGWQALCSHHQHDHHQEHHQGQAGGVLPAQLGLDREALLQARRDLPVGAALAELAAEMRRRGEQRGGDVPLAEAQELFRGLQDLLQEGLDRLLQDPAAPRLLLFCARWTLAACRRAAEQAAPGSRAELEAVQGALDAFYNYIVLFNQVDLPAYLEQGESEFAGAAGAVARLQQLVAPQDRGAAMYFRFKLEEMRATLHKQRGDVSRMLGAFEDAAEVWMQMHQLQSYGSGIGVMDPFAEVQRVLLNVMAFSCDQEGHDGGDGSRVERGLRAARTSLGFFEQTWGGKLGALQAGAAAGAGGAGGAGGGGAWVPAEELGEQAARLYYAGNCAWAAGQQAQARRWYEQSLAALQLEGELFAQQGQGQGQGGDEEEDEVRSKVVQLAAAVRDQLHHLLGPASATPPKRKEEKQKRKAFRRKKKKKG